MEEAILRIAPIFSFPLFPFPVDWTRKLVTALRGLRPSCFTFTRLHDSWVTTSIPLFKSFIIQCHGNVTGTLSFWFIRTQTHSPDYYPALSNYTIISIAYKLRAGLSANLGSIPARDRVWSPSNLLSIGWQGLLTLWGKADGSWSYHSPPLHFEGFITDLTLREEYRFKASWLHSTTHTPHPRPSWLVLYTRRTRWTGHVTHIGKMTNALKILLRKPEGQRPLQGYIGE
jgi:hypothetical protein